MLYLHTGTRTAGKEVTARCIFSKRLQNNQFFYTRIQFIGYSKLNTKFCTDMHLLFYFLKVRVYMIILMAAQLTYTYTYILLYDLLLFMNN